MTPDRVFERLGLHPRRLLLPHAANPASLRLALTTSPIDSPTPCAVPVGWAEITELLARLPRTALQFAGAIIETDDLRFPRAPFLAPLALRVLSRGRIRYVDRKGDVADVNLGWYLRAGLGFARDAIVRRSVVRTVEREVARLERRAPRLPPPLRDGSPLFVRTDLVFGLRAGGSLGHTAGVVNSLGAFGPKPAMVSTDVIPTVDPSVEIVEVAPEPRFWDFRRMPRRAYNLRHARVLADFVAARPTSWIYHRYSLGSYSTAAVAYDSRIPLVVEYNGSEVWSDANWGGGGADELDARVEDAVVRAADLVVVVSGPLGRQLVERGVDEERILVNPNGVDADRYGPHVSGEHVRRRLELGDAVVVGFIGTFGLWHGAEVLAQAFALLAGRPGMEDVRLLFIGDGVRRRAAERILEEAGVLGRVTLTGTVAQAEGPEYLAACDVLVSPHVPNPDGTAFFGSPTKLFEYMAMGKAIVASRLDQIAEVLDDGETALLVEPASTSALADAVVRLVQDAKLRERLGRAAREAAVEHHTWRRHTQRIVDAVERRCGASGDGR